MPRHRVQAVFQEGEDFRKEKLSVRFVALFESCRLNVSPDLGILAGGIGNRALGESRRIQLGEDRLRVVMPKLPRCIVKIAFFHEGAIRVRDVEFQTLNQLLSSAPLDSSGELAAAFSLDLRYVLLDSFPPSPAGGEVGFCFG